MQHDIWYLSGDEPELVFGNASPELAAFVEETVASGAAEGQYAVVEYDGVAEEGSEEEAAILADEAE